MVVLPRFGRCQLSMSSQQEQVTASPWCSAWSICKTATSKTKPQVCTPAAADILFGFWYSFGTSWLVIHGKLVISEELSLESESAVGYHLWMRLQLCVQNYFCTTPFARGTLLRAFPDLWPPTTALCLSRSNEVANLSRYRYRR